MRSLSLFALLLSVAPLLAQPRRPLVIADAQAGFPGGAEGSRRARLGAWTPVYVTLRTPGKDEYTGEWPGVGQGECELVVQGSDGDTVGQFSVDTPAMAPGEQRSVLTYHRFGDRSGQLKIFVRKKDGATLHEFELPRNSFIFIEPHDYLHLAVGGQFPGLRDALVPKQQNNQDPDRAEKRLAVVSRLADLPTRWIGYQGVDVVALATGNTAFLRQLNDPQSQAVPALGEWVRRGGKLVVTVGRNQQEARALLQRLGVKSVALVKTDSVQGLPELRPWAQAAKELPADPIETARMSLKEGALALASDRRGEPEWPILAVAPLGTGRVFLVAFDMDGTSFSGWDGRSAFWEQVHAELGVAREQRAQGGPHLERNELATTLQRSLESFDEVPVISFGWVAFFILIYILIVGPLDYWFLKKVVKRLELTWVTFPLVVLVVSVAAYFTAYRIKGNHLRINKVDVVDVRLSDNEVQGTTWLALFSPRVQAYTVGIDPVQEWGGAGEADDRFGGGTVVVPLNAPDSSPGGVDRPTSASLFRRPYSFEREAAGLRDVPIPVWASRSFAGSWRRRVKPGELIRVEKFGPTATGQKLTGEIFNQLPVELTEASLFYDGFWHRLPNDRLPVGKTTIDFPIKDVEIGSWLNERFRAVFSPRVAPTREFRRSAVTGSFNSEDTQRVSSLMKGLLFHGSDNNPLATQSNSGLRSLDQGWRLRPQRVVGDGGQKRYFDEAILVGRVVQAPAAAEEVSRAGVSPTRVWLGRLPTSGQERAELPGFLGQDTYVRVYIPITRPGN